MVGHGHGLVLRDGVQDTTWLPRPWGGLLVRLEGADREDDVEPALMGIPDQLAFEGTDDITIVSSPVELFNSGEPGLEPLMDRLSVELTPGRYRVRWARHAVNADLTLGVVELRRDDGR